MSVQRSPLLIGLFIAAIVPGTALAANTLSPAETKAGFKLLFDGASTAQWSLNWGIDDSAMHSPNTGAMIYSKAEFANFEWKVDFKVNAGGNSGFFIRTKSDWYCDGFEVAALDSRTGGDADARSNSANGDKLPAGVMNINTGKVFATGSDAPIKRSGAIYDIYPTTRNGKLIPDGGEYVDLMKPAMEWNSLVIWANGNNIETWLNGVKVTDFVIGSADFMARYHRSKFGNNANQCGDDFAKLPTGTLVVQDHGAGLDVWMRNNKIRTITAGAKLTGPVATPDGGTFSGARSVKLDAGITGAAIRYTLDGSDPSETSALYSDSAVLLLDKSATLKYRSFRAGFTASDVGASVFTISGTGIRGGDWVAVPEPAITFQGRTLTVSSRNGLPFTVDLIGMDGKTVRSARVDRSEKKVPLAGLKSGVYVASMQAGEWVSSRRIAIP
jgi:hypothetical protein